MNYQQFISAVAHLTSQMKALNEEHSLVQTAYIKNKWFTPNYQLQAINYWVNTLTTSNIEQWLSPYNIKGSRVEPKTVGIIMAGNIPLVGLHDLLCVLAAGYKAIVKPSSDDETLIKWVVEEIKKAVPEAADDILISTEKLPKNFDAIIATGSNNSFRYFEYYFKDKPALLRKNRNSVAVLTGNETKEELSFLADDVFLYFGLGCRNISKIYLPQNYNFNVLFEAFEKYNELINHHKYSNNYTYHKAIFLMNSTPHLDNGFILLKEDEKIASPLGVLFYEYYQSTEGLQSKLNNMKDHLQCVAGSPSVYDESVNFGSTQQPALNQYADGVDTLNFLINL